MNEEGQDADGACDFGRKSSAVHELIDRRGKVSSCLMVKQDLVGSLGRPWVLKLAAEDCLGCGRA